MIIIITTVLLLLLSFCMRAFYYYPAGPSIGGLDVRCSGHVAKCVPSDMHRADARSTPALVPAAHVHRQTVRAASRHVQYQRPPRSHRHASEHILKAAPNSHHHSLKLEPSRQRLSQTQRWHS